MDKTKLEQIVNGWASNLVAKIDDAIKGEDKHPDDKREWVVYDPDDAGDARWKGESSGFTTWVSDLSDVKKLLTRQDADAYVRGVTTPVAAYQILHISEAREIEDERLHKGKIKIGDGWVDPKSKTMVWHVMTDLSLSPLGLRAISWNFTDDTSHYFLSREKAEAFLKSERIRAGWIEIGNGKMLPKDSTKYWLVYSDGEIDPPNAVTIHQINFGSGKTSNCFATLAEAQAKSDEIHKRLGHIKLADGWWKYGAPYYEVTEDRDIFYWKEDTVGDVYEEIAADCFLTFDAAVAEYKRRFNV